jgi:hypothetical protein
MESTVRYLRAAVVGAVGAVTATGLVFGSGVVQADVPERPAQPLASSIAAIPKGRTILVQKDPAGYLFGYIFEKNHGRMRIAWTYTAGHPTCSKGKVRKGMFRGKTGTDYPSGLQVSRERFTIAASPSHWTLTRPETGESSTLRALSRKGKDHAAFRKRMNRLLGTYCPSILARM